MIREREGERARERDREQERESEQERERESRREGEQERENRWIQSWQAALLAGVDGNEALIGTECEAFETWEGQAVAALLITHTYTHTDTHTRLLLLINPAYMQTHIRVRALWHSWTQSLHSLIHTHSLSQSHDTHGDLLTFCEATQGI